MPFHPCGYVCEMLRAGYTTEIRPFRDSDVTVKIKWFRANVGAPTLPFASSIVSLNWNPFPETKTGPGEVYNVPRPFYHGRPVEGIPAGHVCGPPDWFRRGAPFDPSRPPTQYGPDGIATCCRPLLGGVLLGGTAPAPVADGGLLLGGSAPHYNPVIGSGGAVGGGIASSGAGVEGSGGAVGGGTAEVEYTPPSTPPGPNCAGATTPAFGAANAYNLGFAQVAWWRVPVTVGLAYYVRTTVTSVNVPLVQVAEGTSCADLVPYPFQIPPDCVSYTSAVNGFAYVNVGGNLATTRQGTVEIGLGTCPP
jgi:hypothetical protein